MSDRTSFDFDEGQGFVDNLRGQLDSFNTSTDPFDLKAELNRFLDVGQFDLTAYISEVAGDVEFVENTIAGFGSAPIMVFGHDEGIAIGIPVIDGSANLDALSDEELDWILENRPEILLTLNGVPTELRLEAMHNFQLEAAKDFEVFNASASVAVEVDVWVIEVGAGVQAEIVVMADGTTVLRYSAMGSVGVEGDVGVAEASAEVNGSTTWVFTFPPEEADQALAMINEAQTALVDDLNPTGINDVFESHSDNQTGFILGAGVAVGVEADLPKANDTELSAAFEVGGQMTWDRFSGVHTRGLYLEGSVGDASGRIDVQESFAQNGDPVAAELTISVDAPESFGLPADSGEVKVEVDLSDPRSAAAFEEFRSDPLSATNVASLLTASTVTTTTSRTVIDEEEEFEVDLKAVEIEVSAQVEAEVTVAQAVKAPHTNVFVPVVAPTATGHTIAEQFRDELD